MTKLKVLAAVGHWFNPKRIPRGWVYVVLSRGPKTERLLVRVKDWEKRRFIKARVVSRIPPPDWWSSLS